jgi:hypothetical protein
MLARPVAADQPDLLGVGLVERRVVEDQDAAGAVDQGRASCQRASGSGSRRCRSRVKASWAGGSGISGCTAAASVQQNALGEAMRKLM